MHRYYDEKIVRRGVNTAAPIFIEYNSEYQYPWYVGVKVDETLDKRAAKSRPCQAYGASGHTLPDAIEEARGLEELNVLPRGTLKAIKEMAATPKIKRFISALAAQEPRQAPPSPGC
jgi:hypothetical protein